MLSTKIAELECECEHLRIENDEIREQFRRLVGTEPTLSINCGNCTFYLQHYIYVDGRYKKTDCGHCIHGRRSLQEQKPADQGCKYFEFEARLHNR